VGFNPYRKFRAEPADYLVVLASLAVIGGLLAWAFFG